ncbi:MAG: GNAT family N-acetyltransferase [Myxococcota bacterium]
MTEMPRFATIEHGGPDYAEAIRLRDDLLKNPAGRVTTPEEVEAERPLTHVAGFVGDWLCATCLLVFEPGRVRMKRVAVDPSVQSQGIGTGMLKFCEHHAEVNGVRELYAHAREHAVRFYEKNGYATEGEYFDEVGIPHIVVRKRW